MSAPVSRPILFSGPMVRALLAGSKTQTRRTVKPQPGQSVAKAYACPDGRFTWCLETGHGVRDPFRGPYMVGQLLWVRETWGEFLRQPGVPVYRADDPHALGSSNPWRPSIHMPRKYSRITLRITDVRVERLQEISQDDAIAEGIDGPACARLTTKSPWTGVCAPVAVHAYAALWNEINGPGSWESNPFVWVLSFERVPGHG